MRGLLIEQIGWHTAQFIIPVTPTTEAEELPMNSKLAHSETTHQNRAGDLLPTYHGDKVLPRQSRTRLITGKELMSSKL